MRLLPALAIVAVLGAVVAGREPAPRPAPGPTSAEAAPGLLRVATWNIHAGLGPGFALSQPRAVVERNLRGIAIAIAGAGAPAAPVDVVALNEVDFASRRSGFLDEAAFIAAELGRRTGARWRALTVESWRRDTPGREVRFGNALLVRHRILAVRRLRLGALGGCGAPSSPDGLLRRLVGRVLHEPRTAIAATVVVGGRPLDVVVTHLEAFSGADRERQAAELARLVGSRPTVLAGDLNTWSQPAAAERTWDLLAAARLTDARAAVGGADRIFTFPARRPTRPLDHVLGSPDLRPVAVRPLGGLESDHRGLLVAFAPDVVPASVRPVAAPPLRAVTGEAPERTRWLACVTADGARAL